MDEVTPTAGRGLPKPKWLGFPMSSRLLPAETASVTEKIEWVWDRQKYFQASYARRVPRDSVEDIFQNAVANLTAHLQRGGEVRNLNAFMWRVCSNAAAAELAKIRSRAEVLVDDVSRSVRVEEILAEIDHGEDYSLVRAVLAECLTPAQHKAYVLRVHFGMTSLGIGEVLGKSAGAVRQDLMVAKRKLREPEIRSRLEADYRRRSHPYEGHKKKPKKTGRE
jgi:RNA polymerase sigma factor (sigma-70 family)